MKVIAFGIAKEIIGQQYLNLEEQPSNVLELKKQLLARYPGFLELASLRIAVNEAYAEDDHLLNTTDEIVIIPPVSGG
ncbi:MoaD/ThiS family protein [Sanyastnella coralliicola]|uniref:MoaD/ThiS family protein n=1 Tax=Sanyastnella coralliicola TaxID=3069118 RepID=UPI0027BAFC5A|nr:MoaD/ThiS family protein [Longitalea sp. SCSIO 12813]